MKVRIQREDFDVGVELAGMRAGDPGIGAVAAFVGLVRELNEGERVARMTLEHYPGMTEKAIAEICRQAGERWDIRDTLVIHRIGELEPCDQIVLVAVSGAHRSAAFAACEFIMDYLKTRAPLWKKESGPQGERWVAARESDDEAAARW